MGGTIRTTLRFAGYLAQHREVEILSVVRRRDEPFFPFPDGVKVTALDDQRAGATPRGLRRVRKLMRARKSVLMTPNDRLYAKTSLWTDVMLVRRLRRQTGFLVGTRPGLNLLAADLSPPGLITIGQEHMNLASHPEVLRAAIERSYPALDALVVLTERDLQQYDELLCGRVRVFRMPNAVRPNDGAPAPLDSRTVIAAGRLRRQKGFDMLIDAFARVAPTHPDWRLMICGAGAWRRRLKGRIAAHGLDHRSRWPAPWSRWPTSSARLRCSS